MAKNKYLIKIQKQFLKVWTIFLYQNNNIPSISIGGISLPPPGLQRPHFGPGLQRFSLSPRRPTLVPGSVEQVVILYKQHTSSILPSMADNSKREMFFWIEFDFGWFCSVLESSVCSSYVISSLCSCVIFSRKGYLSPPALQHELLLREHLQVSCFPEQSEPCC